MILFKCTFCTAIFNETHREIKYDKKYFTDEYKAQYGKTYVEDFNNIYNLSRKRIQRIKALTKNISSLLDIGCAYGFFLKSAMDEGITNLSGIEISHEAANYCKKKYAIPVINDRFENVKLSKKYSVITAWYFIEHLSNPLGAITKISDAIEKGGVFAFSVPSAFGPQFFFHKNDWFKNHPLDHRINFTPRCVRILLRSLQFSKIMTYPGGIHPERFFLPHLASVYPFNWIYAKVSHWLSFSDTLEIYAVK
ncbi:MAG: class I SAM-dependent methyltransferase [Spirochaetes bacterium]|nr:class I SAM-dependent methyltransferase [Spirochaetota bacterium]